MRWPLNSVSSTQEFGESAVDYAQFGLAGHHGRDLAANVGTPVYAAESGVVEKSANGITDKYTGRFAAGETITINGSYETWYMHLSQRLVSPGRSVSEGQLIGYSGNTGFTTGPHLHFGTRPLNPNTNNGYRGFVDPRGVVNKVNAPTVGGSEMFNSIEEVREAYIQMRGVVGTDAEMRGWIGQSKQRWIQASTAETNSLRQQLADVKNALTNEQAKPPKEVVKEVIKIVEKPVEVIKEVPVYTHDAETKNMIKSIYDYFSGQFKSFKKYVKKD
jgi:hypothetical protein